VGRGRVIRQRCEGPTSSRRLLEDSLRKQHDPGGAPQDEDVHGEGAAAGIDRVVARLAPRVDVVAAVDL